MMRLFTLAAFLFSCVAVSAQSVVRDIKSFGAKGDGLTNDHEAFQRAAAFFNERGGSGTLVISPGKYIVGKQVFNKNTQSDPVFEGADLLHFSKVNNMIVEGRPGAIIKYTNGLKYGSFDPATGKAGTNGVNFFQRTHIGFIGNAVSFTNSKNVQVRNLELDGNSNEIQLGGIWGDRGRQLAHTGIYITNSVSVIVDQLNVHHFGLDGMVVTNKTGNSNVPDNIIIQNSAFEYNGRQGLSWVGGNDLTAINSKFNHTGKGKITSPPGAGVDIEAEVGPVRNGKFLRCEFINNYGPGMVADSGPSSDMTFTGCTFWGVTMWSAWVNKPGFTFIRSNFYGSVVHGYDANNEAEATKFLGCVFEDRPYNGQEPYGPFLIETNFKRRLRLENCTLIANKKRFFWMETTPTLPPSEKYQMKNCTFYEGSKKLSAKDFQPNPFVNFTD